MDKTDRKTVTAVILTNGRAKRCAQTAHSTATALQNVGGELFVVNNSAKNIPLDIKINGVRCTIINPGLNMGASARNLAISRSKTPFMLMLDDDASIEPEAVQKMVDVFNADHSIGAVNFRIFNDHGEEGCLLPTVFHGCACGFRTSAIRKAGGYPEDFIYYGEEYYLSFELQRAGYRIALLDLPDAAHHFRDNTGRDMNRIIHLLIRNNIYTWTVFFPYKYIPAATVDTLRRYAMVAVKEKAIKGFFKGILSVPFSFARGFIDRKPLPPAVFARITLIEQLEETARKLRHHGIDNIVLCGSGKFPGLWIKILAHHGIHVDHLLDRNHCWNNHTICGKNIYRQFNSISPSGVASPARFSPTEKKAFLSGFASFPENKYWSSLLSATDLFPLDSQVKKEKIADVPTVNMSHICRFFPFSPGNGNGM